MPLLVVANKADIHRIKKMYGPHEFSCCINTNKRALVEAEVSKAGPKAHFVLYQHVYY